MLFSAPMTSSWPGVRGFEEDGALLGIGEAERHGETGWPGQGQARILGQGAGQRGHVHLQTGKTGGLGELGRRRPALPERGLPLREQPRGVGLGGLQGLVERPDALLPIRFQRLPAGLEFRLELRLSFSGDPVDLPDPRAGRLGEPLDGRRAFLFQLRDLSLAVGLVSGRRPVRLPNHQFGPFCLQLGDLLESALPVLLHVAEPGLVFVFHPFQLLLVVRLGLHVAGLERPAGPGHGPGDAPGVRLGAAPAHEVEDYPQDEQAARRQARLRKGERASSKVTQQRHQPDGAEQDQHPHERVLEEPGQRPAAKPVHVGPGGLEQFLELGRQSGCIQGRVRLGGVRRSGQESAESPVAAERIARPLFQAGQGLPVLGQPRFGLLVVLLGGSQAFGVAAVVLQGLGLEAVFALSFAVLELRLHPLVERLSGGVDPGLAPGVARFGGLLPALEGGFGSAHVSSQLLRLVLQRLFPALAQGADADPELLGQFLLAGGEFADSLLQAVQQFQRAVNPQVATHSPSSPSSRVCRVVR